MLAFGFAKTRFPVGRVALAQKYDMALKEVHPTGASSTSSCCAEGKFRYSAAKDRCQGVAVPHTSACMIQEGTE